MRFWLSLTSSGPLKLPHDYNHAVQSLIYRMLSPDFSKFLHEAGFTVGKRSFKLFTFSRLLGRYVMNGAEIVFKPPMKLCISSPVERFVMEAVNGFLSNGKVYLYGEELKVTALELLERPQINDKILCRTLSPITVYSTLMMGDGRRKIYYYSPFEDEFSDIISKNLVKKIQALTGKDLKGYVSIKPHQGSRPREHIHVFKGTVIKSWSGTYEIQGSSELIAMGYEAGIGSKNSQGFGMIEVIRHA